VGLGRERRGRSHRLIQAISRSSRSFRFRQSGMTVSNSPKGVGFRNVRRVGSGNCWKRPVAHYCHHTCHVSFRTLLRAAPFSSFTVSVFVLFGCFVITVQSKREQSGSFSRTRSPWRGRLIGGRLEHGPRAFFQSMHAKYRLLCDPDQPIEPQSFSLRPRLKASPAGRAHHS
jgi:hypothetical protein